MLSADKITYAVKKGKQRVTLNEGKPEARICEFSNKDDRRHCRLILIDQARLIQIGMADTNRLYGFDQIMAAFKILEDRLSIVNAGAAMFKPGAIITWRETMNESDQVRTGVIFGVLPKGSSNAPVHEPKPFYAVHVLTIKPSLPWSTRVFMDNKTIVEHANIRELDRSIGIRMDEENPNADQR
jgi:hypothetical protein